MGDQISLPVYQIGVAGSAEANFSNRLPEKPEIGFGRNHADDALSGAPKRDRHSDIRLRPR